MAIFYSTGGDGYASATGPGQLIHMEGNTTLHLFDIAELIDAVGDVFLCGTGNDTIYAGIGNDIILGGAGNDFISISLGADIMDGGTGFDIYDLTSFSGNYTWNMATGVTSMAGESAMNFEQANMGSGNDTVVGNNSDNTINGGNGNDSIKGSGGNDTIDGGNGNDILQGGSGTDTIYAGNGADVIQLLDGESIDNVYGGSDYDNSVDTLDLSAITSQGAFVDLYNYTWSVPGFGGASDIFNISAVIGTQADDTLVGDQRFYVDPNEVVYVFGMTLDGQGGNDTITGWNSSDTIRGGSGNDTISGGDSVDNIDGGDGNDTIRVLGSDTIDNVTGGSGFDTLDLYGVTKASIVIDLETGIADESGSLGGPVTITGIEHVIGTQLGDVIVGAAADETLDGGNGNDVVRGGGGWDTTIGGAGNDSLFGNAGNDTLNGSIGYDRLAGGGGADTFVFQLSGGADTIRDFQDRADRIDLTAFFFRDASEVLSLAQQVERDVLINLDGRDSILLKNFDLGRLDAGDFIL